MVDAANLRQTAYRLWISDLIRGEFVKSIGEFKPNFVVINGLSISRVNLMGAVIDANNREGYASINVDDGSGSIQIRVWKDDTKIIEGISVGDLVLAVGKVKSFNNRIYVVPDFVRKLDNPDWLKLRKIELEKRFGRAVRAESVSSDDFAVPESKFEEDDVNFAAVQEEKVSDTAVEGVNAKRQAVLSLIESEDRSEGADVAVVVSKSGLNDNEAQRIIDELIREGEIFELKPGFVRTLI